jgi:hypothetical protein
MNTYRTPWARINCNWPSWRDHLPVVESRVPEHIRKRLAKFADANGTQNMQTLDPDPQLQAVYLDIPQRLGLERAYVKLVVQSPGGQIHPHVDTELATPKNEDPEYTLLRRIVKRANPDDTYGHHFRDMSPEEQEQQLERVFVFLEDHEPGQIVMMDNKVINTWRRGDVLWFDWRRCLHATCNISRRTRPILQIMGIRTERWYEIHGSQRLTTIEI